VERSELAELSEELLVAEGLVLLVEALLTGLIELTHFLLNEAELRYRLLL
jgi:hypothetical protein